jgi:hypothetical protein
LRDSGVHINGVNFRQIIGDPRLCLHIDPSQVFQVLPGSRGEALIDLIRMDLSSGTYQLGEQSGVVPDSRADLEHRPAFAKFKRIEPAGVRARLAYVDTTGGVQCDKRVLVDKGWSSLGVLR